MQHAGFHQRTRAHRVNPLLYWVCRTPLVAVARSYWRMKRIGGAHIPAHGPVIIASNHRSFLDPWIIGTLTTRPMYYVAKVELFRYRPVAWFLNSLGAFPVRRGQGDDDAMQTARDLLARGEIVLLFAEGTRTRPGPLGTPKRGLARLALETGAPVVPVAIIGTETIRRGLWLAPGRITVRAGAALEVTPVADATPEDASELLAQVWDRVELQWQAIGGEPRHSDRPVHATAPTA